MALAASKGNLYALQLLLHYGADPRLRDYRGTSPLKCAFEAKRYDIISALATAGADVEETCLVSGVGSVSVLIPWNASFGLGKGATTMIFNDA